MPIDIKELMDAVHNVKKVIFFGFLLLMLNCSKFDLGALNAQRFVDRINSVLNLIATKEKVSLDSSIIDKLVTLRMKKSFMIFVQHNKKGGISIMSQDWMKWLMLMSKFIIKFYIL